MRKSLIAAGFAFATVIGASANAASITLTEFTIDKFNDMTIGQNIETFESYVPTGNWNPLTVTKVGTFDTIGGIGTGRVCQLQTPVGPCDQLALSGETRNGQGNIVPDGGKKSLSNNDTFGIVWEAFETASDGSVVKFDSVIFAVRDIADARTVFNVTVGGVTTTVESLKNNQTRLVEIKFGEFVEKAFISMFNTRDDALRKNDGFTLDGPTTVSSVRISPVPLPAGGLLILTGLAALAAMRKRKTAV